MGDRRAFERKWFGSWWCVFWCLLSKGLLQPLTPSLPQWLDIYSDFSEAIGFAIYFLLLIDAAVSMFLVVLRLPF